jgi:hypothetical protein
MPPSTGDEGAGRQTDAVQREMQRRRAADEPEEPDLVETTGEEQRREREAVEDDADEDDADEES